MKHQFKLETKLLAFVMIVLVACSSCQSKKEKAATNTLPSDSVKAIANDAFVFGLPLVIMDLTKQIWISEGPINQFQHRRKFPDADFRAVVRPNADTYYSSAILDLSQEPIVLSVPNTNGRYYMLPILDAYTNIFASPGKRTTGTEAKNFLITGPKWKGEVRSDLETIASPTSTAWVIGRTQVNSKDDGEKVVYKIQDGFKLIPLSSWGKNYDLPKPISQPEDTNENENPNLSITKMPIDSFFNYMNRLMVDNPPAAADKNVMSLFSKIGVAPGAKFNLQDFDTATQRALKGIPLTVMSQKNLAKASSKKVNGWNITVDGIGTYGTNYLSRAYVAIYGLGANLPADAVYPSCETDENGSLLSGANKYRLHFEKGNTPPAKGFWSITLYSKEGFFAHNSINRYAIGDRDKLKINSDGSVDILIQNESPGKGKESNWLPSPKDEFSLTLRLYWPTEEVLSGNWAPPPVRKVN